MDIATWILVVILSITLLVFLTVAIILIVRLIDVADEAKKIMIRGQDIADNTNDIVVNVKGLTSVGGVVQTFVDRYIEPKLKSRKKEQNERERN